MPCQRQVLQIIPAQHPLKNVTAAYSTGLLYPSNLEGCRVLLGYNGP